MTRVKQQPTLPSHFQDQVVLAVRFQTFLNCFATFIPRFEGYGINMSQTKIGSLPFEPNHLASSTESRF
jgi:hypothetical protein